MCCVIAMLVHDNIIRNKCVKLIGFPHGPFSLCLLQCSCYRPVTWRHETWSILQRKCSMFENIRDLVTISERTCGYSAKSLLHFWWLDLLSSSGDEVSHKERWVFVPAVFIQAFPMRECMEAGEAIGLWRIFPLRLPSACHSLSVITLEGSVALVCEMLTSLALRGSGQWAHP